VKIREFTHTQTHTRYQIVKNAKGGKGKVGSAKGDLRVEVGPQLLFLLDPQAKSMSAASKKHISS
jgi:hypothetical protein